MYFLAKTADNHLVKINCCDNFPILLGEKLSLANTGTVEVVEISGEKVDISYFSFHPKTIGK